MIDKKKIIDIVKNNEVSSGFKCTFDVLIKSRPNPPNLQLSIINFDFPCEDKSNIYSAIIAGSNYTFPVETESDRVEYIDYIENNYILVEKKPEEFNKIFELQVIKNDTITDEFFYGLTKLSKMKKIWIISKDIGEIELLIKHINDSYTFISWGLNEM